MRMMIIDDPKVPDDWSEEKRKCILSWYNNTLGLATMMPNGDLMRDGVKIGFVTKGDNNADQRTDP